MSTPAAEAASAIRKELKKAFPTIKFSVTSSNFAGGNSVSVRYLDGVRSEEVKKITAKYKYGNFNGMQDIYEFTNSRKDIPQVMFLSIERKPSQEIRQKIESSLNLSPNIDQSDKYHMMFRVFSETDFI